jgi:hypothetical protein
VVITDHPKRESGPIVFSASGSKAARENEKDIVPGFSIVVPHALWEPVTHFLRIAVVSFVPGPLTIPLDACAIGCQTSHCNVKAGTPAAEESPLGSDSALTLQCDVGRQTAHAIQRKWQETLGFFHF